MSYCASCETTWELASIRCPDCGTRLGDQPGGTSLHAICESAVGMASFYVGEDVPEKKAKNVYEHYPIGDDELLLLIDATVFGSAKIGVALGRKGIYWNTDWITGSKRHKLTWKQFAKRDLERVGLSLHLGKGDVIDLAATTDTDDVFAFLTRLHNAAKSFA